MKERIDKWDYVKIRNFFLEKTMSREWEDNPQTVRKYLQNTLLIKDCYLKYTKNS